MNISFCIGNGESRKGFNINQLKFWGDVYGANALYRDVKNIDYLVCCDRRMAIETVKNKYIGKVYTRADWYSFFPYSNFECLPQLPWQETEKHTQTFHTGSGLHAVNLACLHGSNLIVLIGHDFWGTGNLHNNIYKGTENYEGEVHHAIDPKFWIKQFEMFFAHYPNTQFVFCQPNLNTWQKPEGWESVDNVQFQSLGGLLDALNQS